MARRTQSAKASKGYHALHLLSRFAGVGLVLALMLAAVDSFLQPVWYYQNNFHTYRSFYQEPRNTIQTLFVGASMTLYGISPMEMYEQDGICSYNLSSTSQPLLMSYYWLKEAKRLHPDTLDTVVLDVSMLRRNSKEEDYRRALDGMARLSPVREEAIQDIATSFADSLAYRFPLLSYHNRWNQIDFTDFVKYSDTLETYARGFFMEFTRVFDTDESKDTPIPEHILDKTATSSTFRMESLYYLQRIVDYCKQEGIRLVLCKTPSASNWTSNNHNAVQEIADEHGLDFVDFHMDPLFSELDYCPPIDSKDNNKHLNYFGALKLSRAMSTYLVQTCHNRDVRDDPTYDFMKEQLERYKDKVVAAADGIMETDPAAYVSTISKADNYSILLTVKGDAASHLSIRQRLVFSEIGLKGLANLSVNDSYVAVLSNGVVEYEGIAHSPSTSFADRVQWQLDKRAEQASQAIRMSDIEHGDWRNDDIEDGEEDASLGLQHSGTLADGTHYILSSGGHSAGNESSCIIAQEEYSHDETGLNIVVWDNDSHRVIDATFFNLEEAELRQDPDVEARLREDRANGKTMAQMDGEERRLYRYMLGVEAYEEATLLHQEIGDRGLLRYLEYYAHDGYVILIAARGEASAGLDASARSALAARGLTTLASLSIRDSYCCIIENGVVIAEEASSLDTITMHHDCFFLRSAGTDKGNTSSIILEANGSTGNLSIDKRGLNVVVYNSTASVVVDRCNFDTHAQGVDVI